MYNEDSTMYTVYNINVQGLTSQDYLEFLQQYWGPGSVQESYNSEHIRLYKCTVNIKNTNSVQ